MHKKLFTNIPLLQQKYKENVNECDGKQNELKSTAKGKHKTDLRRRTTQTSAKERITSE